MSFVHWLVVVSIVISLAGDYAYIKDTLKGKSKPNRVSWALWAFTPMIGVGAALSAGADPWTVIRTFMAGFVPLMILVFSFVNPLSYWKITKFDLFCGACSVVAIILWLVVKNPVMAILFAALGDCFAAIPTLIKSWKFPETETGWTFMAGIFATLIVLPSIQTWNIQSCAFQIYLLVVNIFLTSFIFRKRIFKLSLLRS